jgi:hypothetical protein
MRKLIIIAVCLLSFASCTKKSTSTGTGSGTPSTGTTPVSTFNITIDGHSYNLSGNMTTNPPLGLTASTLGSSVYVLTVTCSDLNKKISFSSQLYKQDLTTATGTYYSGYDSSASGATLPGGIFNYGQLNVCDFADGGKVYSNKHGVYAGQISTANVTVSNESQIKGTFSLKLSYNDKIYNIKGDFDYRK